MFFTRLGTFIAWIAFIMAAGRIGIAIYMVVSIPDAEQAALWSGRYLGSRSAIGSLDMSAIVLAFAIALGVLTEISRALRR